MYSPKEIFALSKIILSTNINVVHAQSPENTLFNYEITKL